MESGDVFVEVYRKEVERAFASGQRCLIMLNNVMEVVGSLSGNGSDLLIAACIAWDE